MGIRGWLPKEEEETDIPEALIRMRVPGVGGPVGGGAGALADALPGAGSPILTDFVRMYPRRERGEKLRRKGGEVWLVHRAQLRDFGIRRSIGAKIQPDFG